MNKAELTALITDRCERIKQFLGDSDLEVNKKTAGPTLSILQKYDVPPHEFVHQLDTILSAIGVLQTHVPELKQNPILRYVFNKAYQGEPQLFLPEKYPLLLRWAIREDFAGVASSLRDILLCRESVVELDLDTIRKASRRLRKWTLDGSLAIPALPADYLSFGSLNLAERCLARCSYCAIGAMPTDSMMTWNMAKAIAENPKITPGFRRFDLRDGEVTIWKDGSAGKDLADVVDLLMDNGAVRVAFQTAGFTSRQAVPNIAFKKMKGKKDLDVIVSFNFLGPMTDESYLVRMRHTFRTFAECDINLVNIVIMAEGDDAMDRTKESLLAILRPIYGQRQGEQYIQDAEKRHAVGPDHSQVVVYDKNERDISPLCEYLIHAKLPENPLSGCISVSGSYMRYTGRLGVRPNGDVIPDCRCPGRRSTKMGNVFENDATQILQAYNEFISIHRARLVKTNACSSSCKLHQKNPIIISPPKSKEPLLRRF